MPIPTHDLPTIRATDIGPPPSWALLQRRLITTMEEAADCFVDKYCRADLSTYYVQDVDDVYEIMHNWGLFYALGADTRILDYALGFWNATTRYYEDTIDVDPRRHPFYMPQLHNEFWNLNVPYNSDWFHIGEGSQSFYDFGLADPSIEENVRRATRFAGLYMGEDPEAPNYDPNHRIIRSPYHGSEGPLRRAASKVPLLHSLGKTTEDIEYAKAWLDHPNYGGFMHRSIVRDWDRWAKGNVRDVGIDSHHLLHPAIKELEPKWWENPERRHQVVETLNTMAFDGDVPENLGATAMVTNAYLYTGDDKYRRWVLDYVDAWLERSHDNGGIIPDNIGPNGVIGEHRNGQWWGSVKGWSREHGAQGLLISVAIGAECAHLLTGDSGYLELLRSQTDALLERSKTGEDGDLLVPMRYGFAPRDPAGDASPEWRDFAKLGIYELSHLYHASMSERDRETIVGLRDSDPQRQWNDVSSQRDRRSGDAEYARFQYYDGLNPNWPLDIQDAELRFVTVMLQAMREDPRDTERIIQDNHWPPVHPEYPERLDYACEAANPLVLKGLTQVTTGAPQNIYNGGLQRGSVRYFDVDRNRPGLPLDVAALVNQLKPDMTGLQLVNTSTTASRRLIVQAGVFGEHQFTDARVLTSRGTASILNPLGWLAESKTTVASIVPVNGKYFAVELPPSTSVRIEAGVKRFANQPSYLSPGSHR
jgi:hypothetical protein